MDRPRFLHVLENFGSPVAADRCARLIEAFAEAADHAVVSGDASHPGVAVKAQITSPSFPPLGGKPWPRRLKSLAEALQGYDLICTYGAGTLDVALAHTMFADVYRLAPLVHHEDGEAPGESRARTLYRRIALGRTSALVVTTRTLERTAIERWQQPRSRVRRIAPGLPRTRKDKRGAAHLPNLIKRRGERWIGAVHTPGHERALATAVRAAASLGDEWHLVIAGTQPGAAALLDEARRAGIEHRVHLAQIADPRGLLPLLDLFAAITPAGELVPEAMAAGLAVAGIDSVDIASMIAEPGRPLLVPEASAEAWATAFSAAAGDPAFRAALGRANAARAREIFAEQAMIERYRSLYWGLAARPRASLAVHPPVDRSE